MKKSLFFTTGYFKYNYTFKYPKATKGDIVNGDDNYLFITDYFNRLEKSLSKNALGDYDYRELIDIKSFAKYFIAAELTGNWEPNLYYVLYSKGSKLKMMPMWDAEWSMGLASQGNENDPVGWFLYPYEPDLSTIIWDKKKYFNCLINDITFRVQLKKEWISFLPKIDAIRQKICEVTQTISTAQTKNFEKWPILDDYPAVSLVALGSWEKEVKYVNNYFDLKVRVLDDYIKNL